MPAVRVAAVGAAALLAVLVLHRVWELLPYPYWLDEAWVAVSVEAPVSELPRLTLSTPLGWTLLLRLPAALPGDPLRLLPLLFHAGAVAAAVALGPALYGPDRARRRVAGPVLALAVAASPFLLVRDDLKAFTADACLVVVVLLLVARLDRAWSASGVWLVAVTSSGAVLVSHAAVFVAPAALLSVAAVQLARRDWRRLGVSLAAGACAAAVLAVTYVVVLRPLRSDGIRDYWAGYYLPADPGEALAYVLLRAEPIGRLLGLRSWWVLAPLLVIGLVTLAVQRRPAVAGTVVLLLLGALGAGRLHVYPLLDQRTSTFLLTAGAVTAATGVLGLHAVLARRWEVLGLPVVGAYALSVALAADGPPTRINIPLQDVRSQVEHVAQERRPGDSVLLSFGASYGFAWYWPGAPSSFPPTAHEPIGFTVAYPEATRIVTTPGRTSEVVLGALESACRLRADGGRVWSVRAHDRTERGSWAQARQRVGVTAAATGVAGLELLQCP